MRYTNKYCIYNMWLSKDTWSIWNDIPSVHGTLPLVITRTSGPLAKEAKHTEAILLFTVKLMKYLGLCNPVESVGIPECVKSWMKTCCWPRLGHFMNCTVAGSRATASWVDMVWVLIVFAENVHHCYLPRDVYGLIIIWLTKPVYLIRLCMLNHASLFVYR